MKSARSKRRIRAPSLRRHYRVKGRRFDVGRGIHCGEKITAFPTGSSPHTSEAWFRAEKANVNILAWGNEQAQGKVVMEFASPPHIRMDCYFSGANVESGRRTAHFPMDSRRSRLPERRIEVIC